MKNLKLSELIKKSGQIKPNLTELSPIEQDEAVQLIPEEIAERIAGGNNRGCTCTNSGCSC